MSDERPLAEWVSKPAYAGIGHSLTVIPGYLNAHSAAATFPQLTEMSRTPSIPKHHVHAVRRAVGRLLDLAAITSPPVDLVRLAELQNVLEIRESPLGTTDAHLTPIENGFVIEVNAFANPERKRFSIAHEIAHTFFNPMARAYRRSGAPISVAGDRPETVVEESLCDIAAAEMLMPESLFTPAAAVEPTIAALQRLATQFKTSLEATALRYARLTAHAVQVTAWRRNYSRLLPKWSHGAAVLQVEAFPFRQANTFVNYHIAKAYLSGELVRVHDVESSCYPAKRIALQAQGFRHGSGRYVLSLMQSAFSLNTDG